MAVLAIFFGWAVLITGRLVWLQVINHADWADKAQRQEERTFLVAPRRGILYDRDLRELAMTVTADSVYAVPSELESDAEKEQTAEALARVVHTDPEDRFTSEQQILARLRDSRRFAWVARKQSPAVIAAVKALHLKGVYLQSEFKRFYPDQDLGAQVLGYVGMDDDGLAGVEQEEEKELHGTPGHMLTAVDARRKVLASQERDPQPGENLVLTVDAEIQYMAEQALERNMERTGAANGTVVVQDPHTGQILALAIRPTFDPNDFRHTDPSLLRDHAVSDVYEPGSTFKLVTYSAAIDQGLATPDSIVDCLGGAIVVAGRTVHDAPGEHMGKVTVTKALEESSDVGAIQMGLRMGKDNFYKYIHAYGFGQKSGIELPGETRGLVKPPNRWQPTTIGSIPMGQEIAVTPIQLAAMVSTIANGGTYLPPHIVLEETADTKASGTLKPAAFHPEDELPAQLPAGSHRVISEMTAAEMRQMMEGVVLFGTGKSAQLNGYSAAGKTGTAQKIDPRTHTYSKTKYVASFAGFAPVNNPAVTIVVVMDSPSKGSHYGAEASAPLFHDLAQQILEYLGVPHDQDLKPEKMIAGNQKPVEEAPPQEEQPADLESLFAEANHLPADDPLSSSAQAASAVASPTQQNQVSDASEVATAAPGPQNKDAAASAPRAPVAADPPVVQAHVMPAAMAEPVRSGSVHVANERVAVPSFLGKSLRDVVVQASGASLGVQVVGAGLARDQVPAAGTMVPVGTE
ncbi:MAG TPA: penicillin-binding transpeptidase domain-containing protein, partial [Acidobacteriaceae bacterium]|nr:penicillin-binding transpeptidase domain-containing protein [Acidobacteriaceae bacterium]